MQGGKSVLISLEGNGLIVKSEVAIAQLAEEAAIIIPEPTTTKPETNIKDYPLKPKEVDVVQEVKLTTRLFGDVELNPVRFYRDAESIEKEILKHLTSIRGVNVKLTLHIEANSDDGFSQDIERTIKENGQTLGFGNVEFE